MRHYVTDGIVFCYLFVLCIPLLIVDIRTVNEPYCFPMGLFLLSETRKGLSGRLIRSCISLGALRWQPFWPDTNDHLQGAVFVTYCASEEFCPCSTRFYDMEPHDAGV